MKGGDFDGMIDLYTYRKDVKGEDGIIYLSLLNTSSLLIIHHMVVKNTN